jgi:hypothetical protein
VAFTFLIRIFPGNIFILMGVIALLSFIVGALLIRKSSELNWKAKEYTINKERLTVINKGLKTTEKVYNLRGLTGMRLEQNLVASKLGYGNIIFTFMGGGEANIRNVLGPHDEMARIQDLLDDGYILEDIDEEDIIQ